MLTIEEKDYVIARLESYLAGMPAFRAIVVAPLHVEVQKQIPDVHTALQCAQEAIRVCIGDGWNRDPPSLVGLLSLLAPADARIAQISVQLRNRPPPGVNPLQATVLATGLPFLNRAKLRTTLQVFGEEVSLRPILVVNGAPKSGRSYTYEYVAHFCQHNPMFVACYSKYGGPSTTPDQVASDLVTSVGGRLTNMPQLSSTNEERWPEQLANWVLTEAAASARAGAPALKFWFVLDGFAGPELSKPVRDFVVHLANKLTSGIHVRMFRLILLEFERSTLTVQVGRVLTDDTGQVTEAEIGDCVRYILARSARAPGVDPQTVAQHILADLPAGAQRLCELNARLCDLLAEVEAAHG